ncbi:MAG: NAD-glutamate dehydrogenase, partial [Longimicrobiales bacterium]|nr:NAD-glutamate dehydrogenase [Longimicrobiales bacterium]
RHGGSTPTRRSGGAPYISFKLAAEELQSIARTRLLYEVWVRSSRMEGVHLRGARVARGGIRWSDRPDDFRTEVLGLVSTQMTKNAVIVPAGSKGGFVTLQEPRDPAEFAEEGREQYKTLIRGLLDLTDNLDDDGEPLAPEGVVCWDEPDPYLVVAADKGTAQFSDIANEVAAEYRFWLGDAFASGGSHGYDHKEVGITARGAWWCVRRHFLEKGKDIQAEPFTVAGIGDMSGDVFGNGMLLSKKIRLVAAFDHRHVFLDPDPDPEASWEERKRLFDMERSTWEDYDRSLLSDGGMIVARGAKEVELTPEVRRVLGIEDPDEDGPEEGSVGRAEDGGAEGGAGQGADGDATGATTLDGEALIRAVLRAPVELLWNGGIGTYVKASDETHADVGDPPNDAVRVDASDLRCEIVGEGGNLGFTQKARVEYALAGGRLNTDALDNSGGVDLSDREVNLKILLNPAVKDGAMSMDDRNALLQELTDSVAEQVVEDNRSQSLAVSLDERRAVDGLDHFRDLMSSLEREGILDRGAEDLPTWEELVERREAGEALTRPELCVLLAYSKLHLMSRLLDSELPDEEATLPYLLEYFPAAAREATGEDRLESHRLRREIVSSQLTNDLVDLMGSTFVHRVARDSGEDPARVAWAWVVAARLAEHGRLMEELEKRAPDVPRAVAYRWLLGLSRLLARSTRWVLANVEAGRSAGDVVRQNREGLARLREGFPDLVRGDDREIFEVRVAELRRLGAEEDFARDLITLRFLDQLLEILRVARGVEADPEDAARAF